MNRYEIHEDLLEKAREEGRRQIRQERAPGDAAAKPYPLWATATCETPRWYREYPVGAAFDSRSPVPSLNSPPSYYREPRLQVSWRRAEERDAMEMRLTLRLGDKTWWQRTYIDAREIAYMHDTPDRWSSYMNALFERSKKELAWQVINDIPCDAPEGGWSW